MGSVQSLYHTENFLHFEVLSSKYNITFFDTEVGRDTTEDVQMGRRYETSTARKMLSTPFPSVIGFNCHINIRDLSSDIARFKTSSKLGTAAALGHNIITTPDEAVYDLLPPDYPFILYSTKIEDVSAMFDMVKNDFMTSKKLWNRGLEIMNTVKEKLEFSRIADQYEEMLQGIAGQQQEMAEA
jgi:hypothetical protein